MLHLGRRVSGPEVPVPGRYDRERGLRVVDRAGVSVPLVDCGNVVNEVTKSDAGRERDDDGLRLASITRTDVRPQQDDAEPKDETSSATTIEEAALLGLLSKTLTHRERDDV